ncbi:MAG: phosphoribosyltransferase [Chloroflexi bacterium]|nr:phosphoribosyltransferase [Chloroflexota bacterium]
MIRFRNREEAGKLLAQRLEDLRGDPRVVVLGVPRGGVVVAAEIARHLGAPLDVYITRKLGAPGNPELAIGAVAEDGTLVLDDKAIYMLAISDAYLERERERQQEEIRRRARIYRAGRPPIPLEGKRVVLVDDGVATGQTLEAAIRALRKQPIAELILAVPVGPPSTIERLRKLVDRLEVLATPEPFWAVGMFYDDFHQVTDEEVIRLLEELRGTSTG